MKFSNALLALVVSLISLCCFASPASAQASRTWVSGIGDDANPCSRTAPCKTFAGAISKTLGGGEIDCLDPGGFGALTITKSITIDCTGTLGGVLNSGVSGFTINDAGTATPGTIEVIIRSVSIDGAGSVAGLNGIRFISGASLTLKDVFIQNQRGGSGISIQPSGLMRFEAENVAVTNNAVGILIQPTGATGQARVVLRNVRADNNSSHGLNVDMTGATGGGVVDVVAEQSSFSRNGLIGVRVFTAAGTIPAVVMLTNSVVAHNLGAAGLVTNGANATMRVAFTTITGNQGGGLSPAGGSQLLSFGNNRNIGNPTPANNNNGTFTGAVLPTQ